jgi:uncharacterized protein (DUF58 family)
MAEKRDRISADVLCKIKEIEIYTRRLLAGGFIGLNKSSIKGSGLEFEQMRDYMAGDDVRYIDWNASSRLDRVVIREYIEEKNKTILLAVDVSSSMFFGSPTCPTKQENVQQLASVLALVGNYAQDKVGLILFSETIECFVPPRQGGNHVRRIIELLFSHQTRQATTSFNTMFDFVGNLKVKNAILFVISDFLTNLPLNVSRLAKKNDLIAIVCRDVYEYTMPAVGLLTITDPESHEEIVLDVRKKGAGVLADFLHEAGRTMINDLRRSGASVITISNDRPFIHEIVKFFRRRLDN